MARSSSAPVAAGRSCRSSSRGGRRGRHRVAAIAALALVGCGDELRIDVHYQVIGLVPAVAGACPTAPTAPPSAAGATKVRFTFRDHGATGPGALRCDAVIARDATTPVLAVPRRGEPVDLWVEYFTDDGTLVARGARAGVQLTGGATITIYASAPDEYACAPAQPTQPRAFHSATRLPGGEVLLLGGLIGAPTAGGVGFLPSDGAYVTSTAEIYDPITERVYPVTIPGLTPRAFHDVIVLGTSGETVQMVVTGGIAVANNAASPGNVAAISGAIGEAPWRAVAADGGLRFGTVAPGPELLSYSAATRGFTRAELTGATGRRFGGGVVDDAELASPRVLAGGEGDATAEVLTATGQVVGALTGVIRVGGTVVATSAQTALWLGGDLGATQLYDELRQLDTQPVLITGPAAPAGSNRGFGAAARVGPDVLYVGGLAISAGAITDATPAPAGYWITPTTGTITPLPDAALVPAAYLGAAQLPGGEVLITGGVTAGVVGCRGTLACISGQSVRVGAAIAATRGSPGLARYGHRLTRLQDGTILVSGGFTSLADDSGQIRATTTLERFEPHDAGDDPLADLLIVRAPGEVALADGVPLAPCALVGSDGDAGLADAAPAIDAVDVDAVEVDATLR